MTDVSKLSFSDFIRGDNKEEVMMEVLDEVQREQLQLLENAEPVAWLVDHDDYGMSVELPDETHTPEILEKERAQGWRLTPLYRRPPSAGVPDWKDPYTNNGDRRHDTDYRHGWNDCRDAMLAAQEEG